MKILITYDSQFGSTKIIADAIAEGFTSDVSAKSLHVKDVKETYLKDINLIVVGSPTQGGRPTVAIEQFIEGLSKKEMKNVRFAAFDTRFHENNLNMMLRILVRTIGYAAPKMHDSLIKKGSVALSKPQGFIVMGKEGPLAEGEIEKAREWGSSLENAYRRQ